MTITGDVVQVSENESPKESSNGHELDLRPIKRYIDSEEDEEDEDIENNEQLEFPNNSADFDYLQQKRKVKIETNFKKYVNFIVF